MMDLSLYSGFSLDAAAKSIVTVTDKSTIGLEGGAPL